MSNTVPRLSPPRALAACTLFAVSLIQGPAALGASDVRPAASVWPACPASDPTAVDPSPETTAPLDSGTYPPPPDSFDPGQVGYVGTRTGIIGYGDPAWVGDIDGSAMDCGSPAHGRVALGVGRDILYQEDTDAGLLPDLLVREPAGTIRTLADRVERMFDGPRFVWVGRRGGTVADPGRDLGVWRIALADGKRRQVLPAGDRRRNDWIVGSPDGRSVAVARYFSPGIDGGGRAPRVRVRFDGGAVTRIPYLVPIGFDSRGRLVGMRNAGLVAYDPRQDRFIDLELGPEGITTPSGRWVISQPVAVPSTGGRSVIRGVRVGDGARRAWKLPRGEWQVNRDLTTDRFVVFWDVDDNTKIGLIDLVDDWVGYLRFQARPMDAISWADLEAACRSMPCCYISC